MSYAGNFQMFGNPAFNTASTDHADWDGETTFSISDGQSNTIMFAEKLAYCPGQSPIAFTPRNGTNNHGGTWWMRGIYRAGTVTGSTPPSSGDSYPGDRVSAVSVSGSIDATTW